jgi:glycerophosphoryl diester phosphodiesterase
MWIIGHRGAAGTWPENTLLAITHALEAGVDWVEIDIRMVEDTIIVLHDDTLERTTNGSGSVYQFSLADLRGLDAGDGERIPLLSEVMDLIDTSAGLNIEIKQPGLNQALVALTSDYIERQPNWRNRLMFSSFIPQVMLDLCAAPPDGCLLGSLSKRGTEESLEFAAGISAFSLNVSLKRLSRRLVQQAHARGLKVLVYTVNDIDDIVRCIDASVDGIFTDYPERAIAFLDNSPMIPGKLD